MASVLERPRIWRSIWPHSRQDGPAAPPVHLGHLAFLQVMRLGGVHSGVRVKDHHHGLAEGAVSWLSTVSDVEWMSPDRPYRFGRWPCTLGSSPSVLRAGPYRFFFYSADRDEPPHAHVEREEGIEVLAGTDPPGEKPWFRPGRAWTHPEVGRERRGLFAEVMA
jgi:hypothetical protein